MNTSKLDIYNSISHIVIQQLVVVENIYLLEALGGSGGPGGNPGRLAEDVGLRPRWNPLPKGRLDCIPFPFTGRWGGGLRTPDDGSLSGFPGRLDNVPGAWSVSDVSKVINMSSGCWPPLPNELSAKEHCVLHMLSLRTASSPNSSINWRQLFILRDWHCA